MSAQISYEEAVTAAKRYVHWLVDCPRCGAPKPTVKPDPNETEWGWCAKCKERFPTFTIRKTRMGDIYWPEGFPWKAPEGWTPESEPES